MDKSSVPRGWTPKWALPVFLAAPVAWYVFSVFIPLAAALFYSLFNWKGGPAKSFAGLANYARLFADKTFWRSFAHNIYIVAVCIAGQVGAAFVLVMMTTARSARLKEIHRAFGFFPSTISAVYIGLLWTMIFDWKRGVLNYVLAKFGRAPQVWLNDPAHVLQYVSIPLVWQFIGYYMVILMSGVAAIDSEIFDEAEIDGANAFQRAVHITLPMIKNTLLVCVTLCVAGNMKVFDHIYTMTAGGPGAASMVMALYGYKVSFEQNNMGYGSAISVAIFIVSLAVIGGIRALINRAARGKDF